MARRIEQKFSCRQEETGVEVYKLKPSTCRDAENQIFKNSI
jgi:hypothetical protein